METLNNTELIQPFQFAFHEVVSKTPPIGGKGAEYFNRLCKGETLTRNEKNELFHMLQGNSGNPDYKVAGWIFPFGQFMRTYLVKYDYERSVWREMKAFDRTCIRYSFYSNRGIVEILDKPIKTK